jgi:putative RNA 2'-phosphotransferase
MRRQYVHLSPDQATAHTVGSRHGTPIIFAVDAAAVHAQNVPFWLAPNGVWLCPSVPPVFLTQMSKIARGAKSVSGDPPVQ